MRQVLAFVLILVCAFGGVQAHALEPARSMTQYQHTTWTFRDGIRGFVLAINQTPDGYLWVGTTAGLYRFDGQHFESFNALTGGSEVAALVVTPSGDLWAASRDKVIRRHQGTFSATPAIGFDRSQYIRYLSVGQGEEIWAATDSQVTHFIGGAWHTIPTDWGSAEGFSNPGGVWAMRVDGSGVVWTKNVTSLYFLRPGAQRFEKAEGYGGGVFDFAKAGDGRLWTSDMVSKHFYALPHIAGPGPAPPPAEIGALVPPAMMGWAAFDSDGALWCANGVSGGLYRVRSVTTSEAGEVFTHQQGLTSVTPHPLFEDREGDIWVGTTGGLDRFSPANVQIEPNVSVWGVGADLGASPNEIYFSDGRQPPGLPHGVESLYRITQGAPQRVTLDMQDSRLISGSPTGGALIGFSHKLVWLHDGKTIEVPLPPEVHSAALDSVASRGEDIWVLLHDGDLFHRHGDGAWTAVKGMSPGFERWIRTDLDGSLWVFNASELERFKNGRWEIFSKSNDTPLGSARTFLARTGGILLAGEFGLAEFDGSSFHTLSREQAPFLEQTAGIVADDRGGTWFRTISGIYRVSSDQLEKAFTDHSIHLGYQTYDGRDGLNSPELFSGVGNSAARAPDGRVWFLNSESLNWIDPRHLYRNMVPPPVSIQSLTAIGRTLAGGAPIRLKAGASNLQIDYAALSLQNPERVRYRYRLSGVDLGWVDAGNRRQAFYTRLRPGRYRFQVIAANNDGVWNDIGAVQDFTIPPTFVQSIWFLLLCGFALILAVWIAFRWRLQQVTAVIQGRHDERIAERQRIARELHDTLLQGFQGVILRFQAIMERLPSDQPARAQIGDTLERADEILISGRDRVSQLRALDAGNLAEALVAAARAASIHSDVDFKFGVHGAARALRPIVIEELVAIGAEAITNALKHAKADSVSVSLGYGQHDLTLEVRDDGVGIDAPTLAQGGRDGHFGFTGMRERAEKLKAKLSVASTKGHGATIKVIVPARVGYLPNTYRWRDRMHTLFETLVPGRSRD